VEQAAHKLGRGLSLEDPDGVLLAHSSKLSSALHAKKYMEMSHSFPHRAAEYPYLTFLDEVDHTCPCGSGKEAGRPESQLRTECIGLKKYPDGTPESSRVKSQSKPDRAAVCVGAGVCCAHFWPYAAHEEEST
jgi:hypothetical protein